MSPEVLSQMWEIYEQAFPVEERRALKEQRTVLKNEQYRVLPYFNPTRTEVVGFAALWDLSTFTFVEHLAVKSSCRNQGYGAKIMKKILEFSSKNLILEVELPDTALAQRRIHFYERAGFCLNTFDYIQPPYQKEGQSVPLYLMSFPDPLSPQKFAKVRSTLYSKVYGVTTDFAS